MHVNKQYLSSALLVVAALVAGFWMFSDNTEPAPAAEIPTITIPEPSTPSTDAQAELREGESRVFGYVRVAYVRDGITYIAFDDAEWYSGTDAVRESIHDGKGEPANGFYIRNTVVTTVRYPVATDASVVMQTWSHDWDGSFMANQEISVSDWIAQLMKEGKGGSNYGLVPYWITLKDGAVVSVREQYLP